MTNSTAKTITLSVSKNGAAPVEFASQNFTVRGFTKIIETYREDRAGLPNFNISPTYEYFLAVDGVEIDLIDLLNEIAISEITTPTQKFETLVEAYEYAA